MFFKNMEPWKDFNLPGESERRRGLVIPGGMRLGGWTFLHFEKYLKEHGVKIHSADRHAIDATFSLSQLYAVAYAMKQKRGHEYYAGLISVKFPSSPRESFAFSTMNFVVGTASYSGAVEHKVSIEQADSC